MLDPGFAFSAGSTLASLSWLCLVVSLFLPPSVRSITWMGTSIAMPALLALAYLVLLAKGLQAGTGGGFRSLGAVRQLFTSDAALAAGWLHYLAFDMFVGTWIAREGANCRLPALLLAPCLVLTFLAGPAGLLAFLGLRLAIAHKWGLLS